jgi:hypothetical protein
MSFFSSYTTQTDLRMQAMVAYKKHNLLWAGVVNRAVIRT